MLLGCDPVMSVLYYGMASCDMVGGVFSSYYNCLQCDLCIVCSGIPRVVSFSVGICSVRWWSMIVCLI